MEKRGHGRHGKRRKINDWIFDLNLFNHVINPPFEKGGARGIFIFQHGAAAPSVSYTHLDVYKRQTWPIAIATAAAVPCLGCNQMSANFEASE